MFKMNIKVTKFIQTEHKFGMNINVNQTKVQPKQQEILLSHKTKFIQQEPEIGMNINVNQTKVRLKQ